FRRLSLQNELILNSLGEGVYGLDLSGRTTFINPAAAKMLGYNAEELIGQAMHDVMHHTRPDGTPYPKEESPIHAAFRDGTEHRVADEVFWKKDGRSFPVEYISTPIRQNGNVVGAVVVFEDVSERKLAEEQRRVLEVQLFQAQKLESIGTLAGGIAHDFNNILAIILGHASVLESATESVEAIRKAVKRGAGLVDQLLTFARKSGVVIESVRVNDVVEELINMLKETFPKTITYSLNLDQTIPTVHADRNQLYQVLLNLCVNARDAMPSGGTMGTLSISTTILSRESLKERFPGASEQMYACISVGDTGTGIDESTRSRIFEPFFTTKELGKGTGLGLAVVYGVVQAHKGFIDVESEPGRGTTFRLYFPVRQYDAESTERDTVQFTEAPGGTETILVVEDEEMLLALVQSRLESKGYTVITAKDGEEAISLYQRHCDEIAIVLIDPGLPKFGGWEAYKKMKEINPNVKAIFASGYVEPGLREEMMKVGTKYFVQKPYVPNEVLKSIREVLDQREATVKT
ncbi:MAG: ATP-binding protein, partial [Spirochaetota bacterium]